MMSLKSRVQKWKFRKSDAYYPVEIPMTFTAPLARSTDPETSHQAAAELTTRQSHAEALLEAFRQAWPEGLTAEEAADGAGIDRWAASKRVSDLRRGYKVSPVRDEAGALLTRIGSSGRPAGVYRADL